MTFPTGFALLFLLGCLLLAAFLTVAAWQRVSRRLRLLRVLAGWAAVAGLWWLVYPPARLVEQNPGAAILLTPGYRLDSLRALQRRLHLARTPALFSVSRSTALADTPIVHNVAAWLQQYPAPAQLHVLGRGLSAEELTDVQTSRLQLYAPPAVSGFTAAQWEPRLELGQTLHVSGRFAAPAGQPATWVVLHAAGAPRDSVRLAPAGTFQLRYVPKAAGAAVYTVQARIGGRVVASEPVPVEVLPTRPLRVLLLSCSPSFEFRFLKNQLAARQHAVAARTGISQQIAQTDFLNQSPHTLSSLTPPVLRRYDVVVVDGSSMVSLTGTEQQALRRATQQEGVGLVVLADNSVLPATVPARADFGLAPASTGKTEQPLQWPDRVQPLRAVLAARLRPAAGTQALITASRRQVVAASQRFGAGQVVVATATDTYRWLLQGAQGSYDAYWSRLLTAAARPQPVVARWQLLTDFPRPHTPVTLRLTTTAALKNTPTIKLPDGSSTALPLQQDAALPEWQTGRFWPAQSGWHEAQLPGQPAHRFYVYPPDVWQGPVQLAWQQYVAAHSNRSAAGLAAKKPEDWPLGWFLGLFLLGASFLWLEEKL
ncbi:hypothetical protein [Hymenobacter guriensis]|uniref:VWA domain-containing protein n=1 Tax=Hymenobacter guriensis TaxID=2793065 RepID=A0ABS0KZ26_9BACT|nr:hypothetical protein [Hymenobacter guriensis]MBG8553099.1 hypothetical protein [Hymenobacter guriensis]